MFLSYFVKILQDKLEVFVGFDERVVYPNLYLFVTAEAGMGKGALTLCRELITPINRQLHELTKTLDAQYKADMAEYTKGKKSSQQTSAVSVLIFKHCHKELRKNCNVITLKHQRHHKSLMMTT